MNEETKLKIQKLAEKYPDDDSLQWIAQLQNDYNKILEERGIKNTPVFKDISASIQKKIDGINALLLNDRTMKDDRRDILFEARDMWIHMSKSFGIEVNDEALKALDKVIDEKLGA